MQKDTQQYKTKLEQEKKILIDELSKISRVNSKNDEEWAAVPESLDILRSDSNEVGDKIESFENNIALVQNLELRLKSVDDALISIENNKYGICKICGRPIEDDRLNANPASSTCIEHRNQ